MSKIPYSIGRIDGDRVLEAYWQQVEPAIQEAANGPLHLRALQAHFLHQLRYPMSVSESEQALHKHFPEIPLTQDWLLGNSRQQPEERLSVYRNAYFSRLHELIKDCFPRVAQLCSEEDFHNCVVDYLLLFPSTSPDIHQVGAHFANFLRDFPRPGAPLWISDLAALEWARWCQILAPNSGLLTRAEMDAHPPETWGALHFEPIAAAALIFCHYSIAGVWKALRKEEDFTEPEARPTHILVWRMQDFAIAHQSLTDTQAQAFRTLQQGQPFAQFCEAFMPTEGTADQDAPEQLQQAIQQAFQTFASWMEDGILARCSKPLEE
ncbi:MAG: DNA-binding domain-containing protein [Myxococcota bacterium]